MLVSQVNSVGPWELVTSCCVQNLLLFKNNTKQERFVETGFQLT
jgi:hypothetical protein